MTNFFPPHLPHLWKKYYRRGKKIPKGFYRITVKAIVVNEKQEILFLREWRFSDKSSEFYRSDNWLYDLPGWWVQYWDGFREGLLRELSEEIWLDESDIVISDHPLYIQISELNDRYFDDPEKDDFYPVLMMYYAVKIQNADVFEKSQYTQFIWENIHEFGQVPIFSHSASLADIFKTTDFPKEFISRI